MAKAPFKRIHRARKVSPPEAAHDREIRRKVMEEFPPLEGAPFSLALSDPLRDAISRSGKSVRRLAKDASVSEVILKQFMDGERDLRLATAGRLAHILGLKLVAS
jgi:hypothetical protein